MADSSSTSRPLSSSPVVVVEDVSLDCLDNAKKQSSKSDFNSHTTSPNEISKRNIDGGYAWVVVFASFFIQFIGDGIAYTFGMFFVEITKGGPVASILVNIFGTRTVSIIGSLVAMAGFSLSYFASRPAVMYGTVGILGGLGFGFMYLPAIVSIPKYFDKKRAFAMGICVAGSGSGTLVMEWIIGLILANFEWRQGLLITAGIIALSIPLGFFYRPSDDPVRESKAVDNSGMNMTDTGSTTRSITKERKKSWWAAFIDLSLMTNFLFLLFSTSDIFTSVGFNVPYVYLPEIEQKLTNSTTTLGFMGGANVISRIVLGYFSDKKFVNRRYLYIFSLTFAGTATTIVPHLTSINLLRGYATLYGICGGIYVSNKSILLVDLLGLERLTDAFGLLSLLQGVGFIIGSPTVGRLYDVFGTYNYGFYFAGLMMFMSGMMLIFIPHVKMVQERRDAISNGTTTTGDPKFGRDNPGFTHYPDLDKDNPDPSNGVILQYYRAHFDHF